LSSVHQRVHTITYAHTYVYVYSVRLHV